nr:hypothetical protein [Tanacetum cinerariifolium]
MCNLPGSGFTFLLAVASFFTGSGKFFCQWELYNWQWECLMHFIPNRHHFIRDCYGKKLISVDHIHTDDNVADLLTKPFDAGRIKTTNDETKILATVDGQPRTISESSIRRNLKLNDEEGISSLPDVKLFENLALMGYNILPNQKFTFQKEIPTLRQYSRRATWIAQSKALHTAADEPASLFRDDSQGEAFPTVSGLEAGQDKENIIQTSALAHDSTPKVTSLDANEGSMQQQLHELTDLCTHLQRQKDKGTTELSRDDVPIKGRILETWEEACVERSTKRGSNDTKEMVNVLTSMDAANILTSGVQAVNVPPVGEIPTIGVPTGSGLVPTVSSIFTTASMVTPYSRRKGKEKMVESDMPKKKKLQEQIDIAKDAEIARIHVEEEQQMMINGLDRNNEMISKHLHEYEQAAAELTIGEKIELINELVKYQDHHEKILKYQAQQSKPLSKKQQIKFYMSVLRSHSGWKTKHFKGMTLEEIREKFIPVWKQIEYFMPMASKEEGERFKRKGLRLEQGSAKKMKTSEEVSEEDLKEMMQLVPVEEVYVEALQMKHQVYGRIVENKMLKLLGIKCKRHSHCQFSSSGIRAWRETLILGEFPSIHTSHSLFNSQKEMDHQYPTVGRIPVLDTGKFEQWQFQIQQYLQHEHYALWEVIEFGDSYKVPTNTDPDNTTTRKDDEQSGRTITITTEDMQRKKNDVKARTSLLLCLPNEHHKNKDGNIACVSTASTAFPTANASVFTISQDTAKLEELKLEKDGLEGKLVGLLKASKNLDNLIKSQRPSPTVASTSAEGQNKDSSTSEDVASPNTPKPFVKFVKPKDSQSESKTDKPETPKKPQVKYAEQYRHLNKKPNVKGNKRNWNNLKSYQLGEFSSIHISHSLFNSQKEIDHQYPTVAKIPVLDSGKFEQWQFQIQQYLQHEHYTLWEVIEFGDSYKVPTNTDPDNMTTRKDNEQSGRTITITTEDMQRKKNDVKARTTLLLSLPDEHQNDLDTMSLDDLYNHLKVYEAEVQKKSNSNSQNMAFISSSKNSSGNEDGNIACVSTFSTTVPTASASVATISQGTPSAYIASQSNDKFWKRTGKKISIQGSYVAGFNKSKVECFNCHKMGHFAKECRAPRRWDWSYMENEGEDHALVADVEDPIEFALMANTESKDHALVADVEDPIEFALMANTESKVFDNSLCSNDCKKNNDSLNKLDELKLEKDRLDGKLAGLLKASKNLDNLIKSQRSDKVKEGVGYNAVPPPAADLYLSSKKDLSWTSLPEFVDDTITDYSRPSSTVASTSAEGQNKDSSTSEDVASPNTPKPFIKFVKSKDSQTESKTDKQETPNKPQVKYAEQYRHSNKKPNVKGNQRKWNNLKSYQLGLEFVLNKKACFNCGDFSHLAIDCRKRVQMDTTRAVPKTTLMTKVIGTVAALGT